MSYFTKRLPILREQRRLAVANNDKVRLMEVDARLDELARAEEGIEEHSESSSPDSGIDLNSLTVAELRDIAKQKELEGYSSLKKAELIDALSDE